MGVLDRYPYIRSPEGKRAVAIVGGITILACATIIGVRGDVARSEREVGNNGISVDTQPKIGAVREAERRVKGKHIDLRGNDMNAPKWV